MSWIPLAAAFLIFSLDVSAAQNPKEPAGFKTWPDLIDKRLQVSYERGQIVCINFFTHKAVTVTHTGKADDPLGYRYSLVPDDDTKLASQLEALAHAGMFNKTTTTGNKVEYRLLPKGWGLSRFYRDFDKAICLETGKWRVGKIIKYQPVIDREAGLNIYLADAEKTYREYEWLKGIDRGLFELKPNPRKTITDMLLIQGPKGYFAAPHYWRHLELPPPPKLPTLEEIQSFVSTNEQFLKSYCQLSRWVNKHSVKPCKVADYLKLAPKLRVLYVGIPKGNIPIFKFVDESDPENPHLGRGYLEVISDKDFKHDSITIYR